jgi:hypothetical protein
MVWYSPVMLFAMIGVARELMQRRNWSNPFIGCAFISFLILWYFNASWWAWWFGDSWGARAFIEINGLFTIGLACLFTHIGQLSVERRRIWIALVGGTICWHWLLVGAWLAKKVPRADYLIPTYRILPMYQIPS